MDCGLYPASSATSLALCYEVLLPLGPLTLPAPRLVLSQEALIQQTSWGEEHCSLPTNSPEDDTGCEYMGLSLWLPPSASSLTEKVSSHAEENKLFSLQHTH